MKILADIYFVSFHAMVGQVWSQRRQRRGSETNKQTNKEFVMLIDPRDRRHTTQGHVGKPPGWSVGRRQDTGVCL